MDKKNHVEIGLDLILNGSSTKREEFPVKWVFAIFQKFSDRYLSKWESSIEGHEKETANEWSKQLRGLTATNIQTGLKVWDGDWPPSAPEFRKACLGISKNEHGLNYVPQIYRAENKIFTAKESNRLFKEKKLQLENKEKESQLNIDNQKHLT